MWNLHLFVENSLLAIQLHGKRKSFALHINVQNLDLDNLADLYNIKRVPDKLMAYLRDMHKSVHMNAYVNEADQSR